jgi:serine/threonine protein phosphatase PrpC
LKIFGKTDIGLVRHSNQDAFQQGSYSENIAWAVVCDGMGGANGGNIASQMAVDQITRQLSSASREHISSQSAKNILMTAVYNANTAIYEYAQKKPELSGMGTTVVLAMIARQTLHVAHVGDSRAYLVSKDEILQITKDHSMVQEMVDRGEITEKEAKVHPRKNIITRALGVNPQVDVDYYELPFPQEDILLLCTDGLSNYLEPNAIYSMAMELDLEQLIEQLVEQSKKMGGRDNITVVAIGNE